MTLRRRGMNDPRARGHEAAGMIIQSTPARRCGSKTWIGAARSGTARQPRIGTAACAAFARGTAALAASNGEASDILWQLAKQARKGVAVQPDPSQVNGWAYP